MENDIEDCLNFSCEVEKKLQSINSAIFSDSYRLELLGLLGEIRNEVSGFSSLSQIQKQESYLKINNLRNDLRLVAYFAH